MRESFIGCNSFASHRIGKKLNVFALTFDLEKQFSNPCLFPQKFDCLLTGCTAIISFF